MNAIFFVMTVLFANRLRYRGTKYVERTEEVCDPDTMSLSIQLNDEYKVTPAILTWEHVKYTVPIGKKQTKLLLDDISGFAKPGFLCALMGSSGAGKTTIMDVLARRKNRGTIEGDVRVNGEVQDDSFRRMSG